MFLYIKLLTVTLVVCANYRKIECKSNEIIDFINESVQRKYKGIQVPDDWKDHVFVKFHSLENSIKVHCPRESDSPFGRVLLRNLFKVYKKFFPNDETVQKIKLSFQQPSGTFISAGDLSRQGYLNSLHYLVQKLPIVDTCSEISNPNTPVSMKHNITMVSPSSISENNSFTFPVYVFYSNDREKLEQESMVSLLVQLGFNVIHQFGNMGSTRDISANSLRVPELLSPKIEDMISKCSHTDEIDPNTID